MGLGSNKSHLIGFRSRKAAQVSALFAIRSGGKIGKLKLSKMLYLSERESMATRGRPIFYDEYYSLKDGPICSNALNGVNRNIDVATWSDYIVKNTNIEVMANDSVSIDDLDEFSASDIEVLDSVWAQFGWMSTGTIREWTHKNCPEYIEVTNGRLPISYRDVYAALGFEHPGHMADEIGAYRNLEAALNI